ncbi:hypothetical protein TVAG_266010 [Trichomonas vaginalis G3]|uniref:Uncharacterized protein n=1 Tax=Trichomonas vaginalis (strain ATCC PRA-98 / G3) TaxID=412133 RepID=A2F2J8_TRIV3|nr:Ankyrin repeat family [Trichomonas vaginalis G3]EAY00898.1 hypothetical protein TVAG_266010 [Trichomonas vaginalis G3]KAI5489229.1 Ankyrin repeat family [Trichomonas vaginalis G3]|eukprot:XP_001313827.1 hypothetical protein [Trichomonas vaginalis G3]
MSFFWRAALQITELNNSKGIVELLISHSANANQKDKDGKTTLHYSTFYQRNEIMFPKNSDVLS